MSGTLGRGGTTGGRTLWQADASRGSPRRGEDGGRWRLRMAGGRGCESLMVSPASEFTSATSNAQNQRQARISQLQHPQLCRPHQPQPAMATKYGFANSLKELRFLLCQTSEHSAAARCVAQSRDAVGVLTEVTPGRSSLARIRP